MNIQQIAEVCHEANRAYCNVNGDDSQPAWDLAPEWQRLSAINGAVLHVNNPDAGPAASHESWMKEKVDAGWVYGQVKDPVAKTHPCIVPYEQLPEFQKIKDYLFIAVVNALAWDLPCTLEMPLDLALF